MRDRTTSVKALSADARDRDVDVLFTAWLVARSVGDLIDTALAGTGLTGDEFAVYSMLAASGTVTPGELARWMAAPPTTVSSYVKRLEARGHVAREPNPDDARSYRLGLTAAGRRAHTKAARRFTPLRERVDAALGPQRDDVREALLGLRAAVDGLRAG